MTLAAKITLDDSSFRSGVSNAEHLGEQLGGKISAMTVAVGQLVADMMRKAINSITSVIHGAIDGFADYQQLIGGVETLFKNSSDKVAGYAKQAFKTAGISANDYMEVVTSFSASLLQGLGGDTEQAAEIANMAIQDMADNANKMGTDMSSVQAAYQGMAKQNYTLLDNLKLGYGGTADEMLRLVNDSKIFDHEIKSLDEITFPDLILAIHAIQTELGITGTTAAEAAETISGSKSSLAAAWEDLLSAVGGEGDQKRLDEAIDNFKTSFGAYMENLIPTLLETVANSGDLVNAIADAIAALPTDLVTKIASAGFGALSDILGAATTIVDWLLDSLTYSLKSAAIDPSDVQEFGEALGLFIGNTVESLLENFPALVEGFLNLGINLAGSILKGIWEGLFGGSNDDELQKLNDELTKTIADAEVSSARAKSILNYMESLHEKYGEAATKTNEWMEAENQLESVLGGSSAVFEQYGTNVQGAIDKLREMTEELRILAIQQAMNDKLEAQYRLLGEAEEKRIRAETERDVAIGEQQNIQDQVAETAKAYARAWLQEYGADEGIGTAAKDEAYHLMRGEILQNGVYVPFAQANMTDIVNSAQTFGSAIDFGEDSVWNESMFDNILDPDVLAKVDEEYQKQQLAIDEANKKIDETTKEIESINKEIDISYKAIQRANEEIAGLGTSAKFAGTAFTSAADAVAQIKLEGGRVKNGVTYMPRAVGLDYAPEGLRVQLHQGEAILTKEENARRGYDGDMEQRLEDAIERAMSGIYFNMNGQRVADLTTTRTARNISANEHARVRAMGG